MSEYYGTGVNQDVIDLVNRYKHYQELQEKFFEPPDVSSE